MTSIKTLLLICNACAAIYLFGWIFFATQLGGIETIFRHHLREYVTVLFPAGAWLLFYIIARRVVIALPDTRRWRTIYIYCALAVIYWGLAVFLMVYVIPFPRA
jgi:hypothetical protein